MMNFRRTSAENHLEMGKQFERRGRTMLLAGLVAAGLWLAGCGADRPIKYYQLTYPSNTTESHDASTYNAALIVRTFITSQMYRDDRIVYSNGAQEMGLYQSNRWAETPDTMLQSVLIRNLRFSGHYRSVTAPRSESKGDFVLSGHLYDFKEVDLPSGIVARLSFDIEMRDIRAMRVVWTHSYNRDEPVGEKTVPAVVAAMDKNVQHSVEEVQAGLDQYFRANPVKP